MVQSRHHNHWSPDACLHALQQNGKSVHRGTAVEKECERAQGEVQLTPEKSNDFQFGREHFHLFESEETLLHFSSQV
jgi:hypothetical protein